MRIRDRDFERAHAGYTHPQTKICLEMRHKIKVTFGRDPGFVYFDKLDFTKIRDIPPTAKRPPKMRPANSMLKNPHANSLTRRR